MSELAAMRPWTGEAGAWVVRGLGAIDLAGGLGVLLPSLPRIRPSLTVTAALGCILLQVGAVLFHAARGEFLAPPVNAVCMGLSLLIFWGRRQRPVQPRGTR